MADYRILPKRYWTDPLAQDLTDKQHLTRLYIRTGHQGCDYTKGSGIFQIARSAFTNAPFNWSLLDATETLQFFNEKKPYLLEYDMENHIAFDKSFFAENDGYKKGLDGIMKDFEATSAKVPRFWVEFGQENRKRLLQALKKELKNPKLPEEDKQERVRFLEHLFDMKNTINQIPDNSPIPENSKKISNVIQYQI